MFRDAMPFFQLIIVNPNYMKLPAHCKLQVYKSNKNVHRLNRCLKCQQQLQVYSKTNEIAVHYKLDYFLVDHTYLDNLITHLQL